MNAEYRGRYLGALLDKVREDIYPSTTHMDLIERVIPPEVVPLYLDVLLDKVESEPHPSISMLRRIERMTEYAR